MPLPVNVRDGYKEQLRSELEFSKVLTNFVLALGGASGALLLYPPTPFHRWAGVAVAVSTIALSVWTGLLAQNVRRIVKLLKEDV